jgi:predicted aspartyl protease
MIHGYFSPDANLPYVHVGVVFGEKIVQGAFILDTGFSGDLKIDYQTAQELGIVEADEIGFVNANGERVLGAFVYGYADMENRRVPIRIIIVNGSQLAGMGLFTVFGYRIMVDGKNRTAHLEWVA